MSVVHRQTRRPTHGPTRGPSRVVPQDMNLEARRHKGFVTTLLLALANQDCRRPRVAGVTRKQVGAAEAVVAVAAAGELEPCWGNRMHWRSLKEPPSN